MTLQDQTLGTEIPELFTLDGVSSLLGVGLRTLKGWISEGRLTITRIGPRTIRVSKTDLLEFLDAARERVGSE